MHPFDAASGRLTAILAGTGNIVENFSYTYDVLGNVLTRADANESLTETLTYDTLNRLASATVSQNIASVKTFSYDPIGNLLSKSDVGTYTYPLAGAALPHAVISVAGSTINSTFTYDANGNQTAGLGRSVSYTSYNKPSSITQGIGHAVLPPRHRPPALPAAGDRGHDALLRCVRGACRAVRLRQHAMERLSRGRRLHARGARAALRQQRHDAVFPHRQSGLARRHHGRERQRGRARQLRRVGQAALPHGGGRPDRQHNKPGDGAGRVVRPRGEAP